MYYWLDPKLLGTISYFDNTEKVKESQIEVGHSSDGPVSRVKGGKRIFNYFDECFIPFYMYIFPRLNSRVPFNAFEEEFLRCMNIALSQLHLFARLFAKVFQYWYEYGVKKASLVSFSKKIMCHILPRIPTMGR